MNVRVYDDDNKYIKQCALDNNEQIYGERARTGLGNYYLGNDINFEYESITFQQCSNDGTNIRSIQYFNGFETKRTFRFISEQDACVSSKQ